MGLIHGKRHQPSRIGMVLQQTLGGFPLQAFRRHIQQAQSFITEVCKSLLPPHRVQAGVKTGRGNPSTLQLQHLIFHQSH